MNNSFEYGIKFFIKKFDLKTNYFKKNIQNYIFSDFLENFNNYIHVYFHQILILNKYHNLFGFVKIYYWPNERNLLSRRSNRKPESTMVLIANVRKELNETERIQNIVVISCVGYSEREVTDKENVDKVLEILN